MINNMPCRRRAMHAMKGQVEHLQKQMDAHNIKVVSFTEVCPACNRAFTENAKASNDETKGKVKVESSKTLTIKTRRARKK